MKNRRKHHELQVWQEGESLVRMIYEVTSGFPVHETFGLTSQLRHAAVAIPSNIAEGAGRSCPTEFLKFLDIAKASLGELESWILHAEDLGYFQDSLPLIDKMKRVSGLLGGLMSSLGKS